MDKNELLKRKVVEIFDLTVEISTKTECDVFFSYSPHVNKISIEVYNQGWSSDRDEDMAFESHVLVEDEYYSFEGNMDDLNKILDFLKEKVIK